MAPVFEDPEFNELKARVDALEAKPEVKFKKLHPDAVIPQYQTSGAAGMDLVAIADTTLQPNQFVLVGTGLAMELPPGWEAQVRPRSGLAAIQGITVLNTPGTIDNDFRNEIKVILINHNGLYTVHKGDRIAQMVIAKAVQATVVESKELSDTKRGMGGFGSTGV